MNIDYSKKSNNTAVITLTVGPEDYKAAFEEEIKKQQKSANFRGFRKGKTPRSMILKMYGKAILADLVTNKVQESFSEYLKKEKIETLGDPLPIEREQPLQFEPGKDEEYTFAFELGLVPDFELPEFSEPFHYYDTEIEEEKIDEQMEFYRLRVGHQETVEYDFEDKDIISFNGWELEEGELKQDGLEVTFQMSVDQMKDEFRSKVLERVLGDEFDHNIYEVEKELSEKAVRKYLMELDDEEMDREVNAEFRLEIVEATRQVPAEIDEEFLTTFFGEDVTTEEEARNAIRDEMKRSFDEQADTILFDEVYEKLLAETEIDLPDDFLKRFYKFNAEKKEDGSEITDEDAEDSYTEEVRSGFRGELIMQKLARKYEIKIEEQEIIDELYRRVQSYLPGQQLDQSVMNRIIENMAQDRNQVNSVVGQIRARKIIRHIKNDIPLEKEAISPDAFNDILRELSKDRYGTDYDDDDDDEDYPILEEE